MSLIRALCGAGQGLALHFVLRWIDAGGGAAALGVLVALAFAVPALLLTVPVLSWRAGLAWSAALGLVLFGLGTYHGWQVPKPFESEFFLPIFSILQMMFYVTFISSCLLLAGARDRRFIAGYSTYFDVAWSKAAQIVLGFGFALLVVLIVFLGAGLFAIVHLQGLLRLIEHRYIWLPLLTTGFAVSISITDARVNLLHAARGLFLTLAAWLLPLLAVLAAGFLLVLPMTGLAPIWATHNAGLTLAGTLFLLVLLINAAYGDGTPATTPSREPKLAAMLGAILLVPLLILAATAITLRCRQHGLTPRRIFDIADLCVLGFYAVGYPLALVWRGPWLHGLQSTNVAGAYGVLGIILLLWSPVLDPNRLSVADQLARLRDGRTPADKFDYTYLRFGAGRYGRDALQALAGSSSATVAEGARRAQAATDALTLRQKLQDGVLTAAEKRQQIKVYPDGASLPEDFWTVATDGPGMLLPCVTKPSFSCGARLVDFLGQGRPQILLFNANIFRLVAQDKPNSAWYVVQTFISGSGQCAALLDALRKGTYTLVPAAGFELRAGNQRLAFPEATRGLFCPMGQER